MWTIVLLISAISSGIGVASLWFVEPRFMWIFPSILWILTYHRWLSLEFKMEDMLKQYQYLIRSKRAYEKAGHKSDTKRG